MVGGTIIDIVKVRPDFWWVNCAELGRNSDPEKVYSETCAVYCNPMGMEIRIGDTLWWQGKFCYWSNRERGISEHKIPKIGYSGVLRPKT